MLEAVAAAPVAQNAAIRLPDDLPVPASTLLRALPVTVTEPPAAPELVDYQAPGADTLEPYAATASLGNRLRRFHSARVGHRTPCGFALPRRRSNRVQSDPL